MWNLLMGALVSSEDEGEVGGAPASLQDTGDASLPSKGVETREYFAEENVDKQGLEATETNIVQVEQDALKEKQKNMDGNKSEMLNTTNDPVQLRHVKNQGRREDGDGMEKPVMVKTSSEMLTGVVLPDTGLALDKLPPISDKVDLLPVIPRSTLVKEKAKVYPKGTYPPAVKKSKEARFVPCEPYKGAVSPLVNKNGSGRPRSTRSSPEKSVFAPNLGVFTNTGKKERSQSTASNPKSPEAISNLGEDRFNTSVKENTNELEDETDGLEMNPMLETNYRIMLDAKERELDRLRSALTEAEKQLRIQSQVNSELKSLLVASVGEDIEARLDFLTQDKARLAADLIHYNNKISRDWEEKEALHVESDIWRSKFLASTVILEELTRNKQSLESRTHQLEHTARRMIIERKDFATKLNVADNMLISMLPRATSPAPHDGMEATSSQNKIHVDETKDLGTLCASIEANTRRICDKLPGDRITRYTPATEPIYKPTQPEKEMEHLLALAEQHSHDSDLPAEASGRLTRGARTMLLKMGDKAQSPGKSAFESCSHCNGTVETI